MGRAKHRNNTRSRDRRPQLQFESLEYRRVLATFTVTDVGDGQGMTLRRAVEMANAEPGPDVVLFDAALAGERILLTGSDIQILDDLQIDASELSAPIIVDASGNDPTPEIDDQLGSRVFTIDNGVSSNISVGIHGLTLTGGDVVGSGGAIYSSEVLDLRDVELVDNHASMHGGGLRLVAEEGAILGFDGFDVRIVDNRAGLDGGGISTNGWATVRTLEDALIRDNQAGGNGGGMHLPGALHWINRTQLSNNSASNGGAIYFSNFEFEGGLIVRNSTILSNQASNDGGGVFAESNASLSGLPVGLQLMQITVSQNAAGQAGGGIFVDVTNDATNEVTFLLERSTVVQNVANVSLLAEPATGGGLHIGGDATRFMGRTALADNSRLTGSDESTPDDLSGDILADYSLIEASPDEFVIDGTGNLFGLEPDLSDLADNGGPTLTHLPNSSSPLIDAGGPATFFDETDQRGLPREIDGLGDGEAVLDIGAVERQLGNTAPTTNAGADSITRVGLPIILDGLASFDADDDELTYEWRVVQVTFPDEIVFGEIAASFDDRNSPTPLFTPWETALFEIELTVSDGLVTDSDTVIVEAAGNEAPFAVATTFTLTPSLRFPLELDGQLSTDPESDPLAFAWSVVDAPAGSTFEFDDAAASVAFLTADTPGEYRLQLTVDDELGSGAPFEFTVTFEQTIPAGGPYAIVAGNDLQLYGPSFSLPNGGGLAPVIWDLDNDGSHSDALGNTPLISWTMLESILGPDPAGVFPISAEVLLLDGSISRHESMLTIFPAGLPQVTGDRGAYGLTGDIDGDGDIDAVGKRDSLGQINAYFNDGQGNFSELPAAGDEMLFFAQAAALTDADLDGDLDLIITPRVKPTTLLLNDGTGSFASVSEFASANSKYGQVHASDINADGAPDVFVADIGSVQLYVNDGVGNLLFDRALFTSHPDQDVELGEIRDLVFADFDGDELVDVMIERTDESKDFWIGQGNGDFAWSTNDLSALPPLAALASPPTDLDTDHDLDWVGRDGRIYRQDASGSFFDVDFVRTLLDVRTVADMNNDGHPDIVAEFENPAAFTDNNQLQVFLNDGLGTYSSEFPLGLTLDLANNSQFLLEDLDGDGRKDLLKPGITAAEIWFNQVVPASWHLVEFPADVNDSGEVSPLDPLLVINELNDRELSTNDAGILAVAPASITAYVDVNDDGVLSPLDAALAINALTDGSGGPVLAKLPDVTLKTGSPLAIPLAGRAASGVPITFTVTSSNSMVTAWIPEGNRSLQVSVSSPANSIDGQMTFQLFENYVPRVTNQIIQFAQSGFYDGLTFHRILDDFVIQGGDPKGDGTGGSELPDFDDQFHPHLQHNQTGILSMAKSFDDTNNSQFFITEGPSRHLDFNHSILGFLVEGEATRQAVSNVPANGSGVPDTPVVMTDVDVVIDNQNRVLLLDAPPGFTGTAKITVTASVNGQSLDRMFRVTVVPDDDNSRPFLADIPHLTTAVDTEIIYQLMATDVEDDNIDYWGPQESLNAPADFFPVEFPPNEVIVSVDRATGLLRVVPTNSYTGTFEMTVSVAVTEFATRDYQTISVTVG